MTERNSIRRRFVRNIFPAALMVLVFALTASSAWAAGTLTGKVTDSVSRAVLPGATVSATGTPGTFTGTTGATGIYTISLPAGTYTVTATAPLYKTYTKTGVVITDLKSTSLNIALVPTAGTLTGTVTDSVTRVAIPGATVATTAGGYSTVSDATGKYTLKMLAGTYTVTCAAAGYQTYTKTGVIIAAGKTTTLNVALVKAVSYGGVDHIAKISVYAGPPTCLACHAVSSTGTNLLNDVVSSVHFQLRTVNALIDMPAGGSHGMLDRACGLPGTTIMANNYAGTATGTDGVTKLDDGCGKCHPAFMLPYRYPSASDAQNDIDCLFCHAEFYAAEWDDPAVTGVYGVNPEPHLRVVVTLANGLKSWSQDRSLKTAQSVGNLPKTKYCLRCHEHGLDGYKRATPYTEINDVHATKGKGCIDCHNVKEHKIARGNYVTDGMANEVPTIDVSCDKCHGFSPHIANNAADLNKHTTNLSCEACHVPSMNKEFGNIVKTRAWAPFTFNPVTGTWSSTPAMTNAEYPGFYDANTVYYAEGAWPAIRWFNARASMLAQPFGGYSDRRSGGATGRRPGR